MRSLRLMRWRERRGYKGMCSVLLRGLVEDVTIGVVGRGTVPVSVGRPGGAGVPLAVGCTTKWLSGER